MFKFSIKLILNYLFTNNSRNLNYFRNWQAKIVSNRIWNKNQIIRIHQKWNKRRQISGVNKASSTSASSENASASFSPSQDKDSRRSTSTITFNNRSNSIKKPVQKWLRNIIKSNLESKKQRETEERSSNHKGKLKQEYSWFEFSR